MRCCSIDRRALMVGMGWSALCASAGQSFAQSPRDAAALERLEAEFFLCGTQQIMDLSIEDYGASGAPELSIDTAPPSTNIAIDDYTTAQRALRWRPQDVQETRQGRPVLRIRFLDGDDWQQKTVRELSQQWRDHDLGIDFTFVGQDEMAEIAISFAGTTNKSEIGRASRVVSYGGRASMALPDVKKGQSSERLRRVVLHEFGHGVMTFGHEHQHPNAKLQFKSASVISKWINEQLPRGSRRWTIGDVRANITNPLPSDRECTQYDTGSIMHYPVHPDWLEAGSGLLEVATTLSQRDIECAKIVYPA